MEDRADAAHPQTSLKTASLPVLVYRASSSALLDRLRSPRARVAGDVPWSISAITADWLEVSLAPLADGPLIADLRIEAASSGTSVRGRLTVEYTSEGRALGLPTTFFCKSTPTFTTRIANGLSNCMTFEGLFYRRLRGEVELEAPRGYFSDCDTRTLRSIHVLEDLVATKGATFCSIDTKIDLDEARDALGLLATLHGTFLRNERLATEHSWLPEFKAWYERGMEVTNIHASHAKALDLSVREGALPAGLVDRRHEIWPRFLEVLALNASLPPTLLHSDVHLANWYKTDAGRMGLCDWQCVAKGHWGRDLAYALATMLRVEDRRSWERELVADYARRLSDVSGLVVDFDEAWLRYRQHVPAAMLMWTPTLVSPRFLPDMQPRDLALELVERTATAMDDLGSLDAIA